MGHSYPTLAVLPGMRFIGWLRIQVQQFNVLCALSCFPCAGGCNMGRCVGCSRFGSDITVNSLFGGSPCYMRYVFGGSIVCGSCMRYCFPHGCVCHDGKAYRCRSKWCSVECYEAYIVTDFFTIVGLRIEGRPPGQRPC